MMFPILRSSVFMALLLVESAYAGNVSGTYVGKGPNSAVMVQLVEGAGGSLTGRYVQSRLLASGGVEQTNAAVTGAVDGGTVVVTIKPAELMAGSLTASGAVNGSALHLTGGGYGTTLTLELTKTDEGEFRKLVASLELQSQLTAAARSQSQFLARVNKTISSLEVFSKEIDSMRSKLVTASIDQKYRQATEWMRTAHARQAMIFGEGQASVARSQIGVAINQASIQINQLHSEVESTQQSFHSNSESLGKNTMEVFQNCSPMVTISAATSSPETKASCTKLSEWLKNITPRVKALDASFSDIERVWKDERQKQEQIVRAADYASR